MSRRRSEMSRKIIKTADRLTVTLGGTTYAKEGACLSLIGDKESPPYLRASIHPPNDGLVRGELCAWCQGRPLEAFILEAARRLKAIRTARKRNTRKAKAKDA